jgi:hypothetical protein
MSNSISTTKDRIAFRKGISTNATKIIMLINKKARKGTTITLVSRNKIGKVLNL